MLRRFIKHKVAATIEASGFLKTLDLARGARQQPLVVGYHQVVRHFLPHGQIGIAPMQISTTMLERHLDWIGARYEFVSLDHIGAHYETGEPFSRPTAAVTFDDGYRDVYTNAFPLLKRKGIPATVFAVTDLVGTEKPLLHDSLHAALVIAFNSWPSPQKTLTERLTQSKTPPEVISRVEKSPGPFGALRVLLNTLPYNELESALFFIERDLPSFSLALDEARPLTWEMLLEMSRAGITIGSHTKTHVLLPVESSERQLEEVMGSKSALERALGLPVRHFAYPDGRFDPRTAAAVAVSGYRFAFTTCYHQLPAYPLMTIPRRMLWEHSCIDSLERFSGPIMTCLVHGLFDWLQRCPYPHDHVTATTPHLSRTQSQTAGSQCGGRDS